MKTEVQTYCKDLSRLKYLSVTPEEMEQLEKDMEEFFHPKTDPFDMSKETRLRAEEELNENPSTILESIQKLREMIDADPKLIGRTDDMFLCSFLRGKKYDIERAYSSYRTAFEMKAKYPEFHEYITEDSFHIVSDQNHLGSLPGVDRKGRKIIVLKVGNLPVDVPISVFFRMGTGYLELMLSDVDIQVNGFVIIMDLLNISLMHKIRILTPSLARHLAGLLQDKIPMRVKRVHITNQPFYFKALYLVFKPFLKKKLRKRIKLYGNNWDALHEEIAPESLPVEFGGTRPAFNTHLTMSILELNLHKFKEWKKFFFKID